MANHRGRNEGSILREPSGNFRAVISLPGGKRKSKTFSTKGECKAWIHAMQNQINQGLTYAKANIILEAYAVTWLDAIGEKRAEKTYIQYQSILARFILPGFGRMRLRDIEPLQVEAYLVNKRKEDLGERTLQLIYVIFHAIMRKAALQRLITFNPLDAVEKPGYKPKKKSRLSLEQRRKLLLFAQGDRHEALYTIALTKGLREGELLGLKWEDLDWKNGTLHVQRQVYRLPGKGMVFADPKTDSGDRFIVLGEQTLAILKKQQQRLGEIKTLMGDSWKEHGLIFPGSVGSPMDPRNLLRDFKAFLQRAGLPDTTIHDLRHAALTTITNDVKAPIKITQEVAGHAMPSTTLNIYTDKVDISRHYDVARAVERLLIPV